MRCWLWMVLLLIPAGLWAQPDTVWTRRFGGSGDEIGRRIHATRDGGFVVVGSSTSESAGGKDAYMTILSRNGTLLRSRLYGGIRDDEFCDAVELDDYGWLFAGTTRSYGSGGDNYWLVRTSNMGDTMWTRTFGGIGDQRCTAIVAASDGGYLVGGTATGFMSTRTDIFVTKTNSQGIEQWNRTIGDTANEGLSAMLQLADGSYVLAGQKDVVRGAQTGREPWLTRINSQGSPQWVRLYEGVFPARCTAVAGVAAGGLILGATADRYSHGEIGMFGESMMMKVTSEGLSEWLSICGLAYDDSLLDVAVTPEGDFVGVGSRNGPGEEADGFLVKVENHVNTGDTVWTSSLGGVYTDLFRSVLMWDSGRCVAAGQTWSHSMGEESDLWLVMFDSVYTPLAAGGTRHMPESFRLTAYPNPFNSRAGIEFSLSRAGRAQLDVFDTSGRQVACLLDGRLEAGAHRVEVDGGALASGVYFCRLEAGGGREMVKLLLVR